MRRRLTSVGRNCNRFSGCFRTRRSRQAIGSEVLGEPEPLSTYEELVALDANNVPRKLDRAILEVDCIYDLVSVPCMRRV
jgi:hypothetical protein